MATMEFYTNGTREYRITRNDVGIKDVSCRQGYYVSAHSPWHAIELICARLAFNERMTADEKWDAKATTETRWETKTFTIQLWK